MKSNNISAFMLERFKLGELNPDEQELVKNILTADSSLKEQLDKLNESDRELRLRYPINNLNLPKQRFFHSRAVYSIGLAALVIAAILLPVMFVTRNNNAAAVTVLQDFQTDRIKGQTPQDLELSVYLKGDSEIILSSQAVLEEGNTLQLAYTVPAGAEHYGVIFSIDGRSVITMHYPYRRGQSSLLVSGKRTFLNEAYTLDDAPGYEVFILVVSDEPLDANFVIREAHSIAGEEQTNIIEEKSKTVFKDFDVETITILKKQ